MYVILICVYKFGLWPSGWPSHIYTHPHKLSIYSMYTSQGIQKIHGHIGTASDRPAVL